MPTPIRWQVPKELSAAEARVAQKLRRIGKFYVFLREIRAELFDETFEAELAAAYHPRGVAPLPPALLGMQKPWSRRHWTRAGKCHSAVWGSPTRRSPKGRW
jgi:hypothetical protein